MGLVVWHDGPDRRSTENLIDTLGKLAGWNASVVAMSGMTFEFGTPHDRISAPLLEGTAQFERELISERAKSGPAAGKARGKKPGRETGQHPKLDRVPPEMLRAVEEGPSYRWIDTGCGDKQEHCWRHRQAGS